MNTDRYHHGDLKQALVNAGIEMLKTQEISALSLRAVARAAGVSHSAPYAHFSDKQALLAAISAESFHQLQERVAAIINKTDVTAKTILQNVSWAYVQFALENPSRFKLMFSGVVENDQDHPALVEMTHSTFQLLVNLVIKCQQAGVLKPGPADVIAVGVWSMVHGFVSLYLENQFSHQVIESIPLSQLLFNCLDQMTTTTALKN